MKETQTFKECLLFITDAFLLVGEAFKRAIKTAKKLNQYKSLY